MPIIKELHILSRKYWWILLPIFSPLLAIIMTYNLGGKYSNLQAILRFWWIPSYFAELTIIIIGMMRGMTIVAACRGLKKWQGICLFIWLAVIAIGIFNAPYDQKGAAFGAITWVIHAMFIASAYYLISDMREEKADQVKVQQQLFETNLSPLEAMAVIFGGVTSLCGISLFLFVYLAGTGSNIEWSTDLPGQVNIRHFGYYFLPSVALSAAFFLGGKSHFKYAHLLFFAIGLCFLFWSGSRGPIFALAAIFTLYCGIFFKKLWAKNIGILLGATAFSAIGSTMILTPPHPSFGFFQRPLASTVDDEWGYSSGRTALWKDSIPFIAKRPIMGYGAHQFRAIVPEARGMSRHPHNVVLQALFEWGILGSLALFALIIPMGWSALRRLFDDPITYGPMAISMASMAAFSMIDGVFYYPLAIMLFFLIAWLPNNKFNETA